jgi:hypothetical protein
MGKKAEVEMGRSQGRLAKVTLIEKPRGFAIWVKRQR